MSVAFGSAGTQGVAVGGTSLVPGTVALTGTDLPASDAAGDGKIAFIFWGNATDSPVVYPSSTWQFLGDVAGGEGSWAVDTGLRHISAYWTTADLTGTTQSFTNGGAPDVSNVIAGYVVRYTKTLTYWDTRAVAEAFDNVAASAFSATFNVDPGGDVGDMSALGLVANTDAVNPAGVTLTWPGTTGTATARFTSPYSQGNDLRIVVRDRTVATGPSTGVPSVASSTTFSGAALLVRLRDTNTAPTATPVASAPADGVVEPWLSFTLDGSGSTYQSGATFAWTDVTSGGTGTVVIDDPTALVTTAHVNPTVWADEVKSFQLAVTDAGGTDSTTVTRTVLRSSEMIRLSGVDKPLRLTF